MAHNRPLCAANSDSTGPWLVLKSPSLLQHMIVESERFRYTFERIKLIGWIGKTKGEMRTPKLEFRSSAFLSPNSST